MKAGVWRIVTVCKGKYLIYSTVQYYIVKAEEVRYDMIYVTIIVVDA